MAFYSLFSHSIKIEYKGKLFSQATIFYSICVAVNLMLPLVIIYRSEGLWKTIEDLRVQPFVDFKHQLIVFLEMNEPEPGFKFWSSFPPLNKAYGPNHIRIPYITVSLF